MLLTDCCLCSSFQTDDKGVFSTSLSREYHLAAEIFGLTKQQLRQISYDTIDYAFTQPQVKTDLKQQWKAWAEQQNTH